jgi:hypothetical protein
VSKIWTCFGNLFLGGCAQDDADLGRCVKQQQIPSLRCGMTTKRTDNGKKAKAQGTAKATAGARAF